VTHQGYIVEYLRKNGTSYAKRRFMHSQSEIWVFKTRQIALAEARGMGKIRVVEISWWEEQ